jgi:N-acetylglucosaminyldiphosphoundecaprenol N-acetyl-beta-D-mannosaminyltransferase
MLVNYQLFCQPLNDIQKDKVLINTINAHCYNMTFRDAFYREALMRCDVLLPDGISIVWAIKWLTGQKLYKISGADLFYYEMQRLQRFGGKCFFLGSTNSTLNKIKKRVTLEYQNIKIQTYSPPYKLEFTAKDDAIMMELINAFQPDTLMIGMTAPKQEKWAYKHYNNLRVGHVCCIGAVFDFYAGNVNRAPKWMIKLGLEWMYRLIKEPKRMWRRYLIGNLLFTWYIIIKKK